MPRDAVPEAVPLAVVSTATTTLGGTVIEVAARVRLTDGEG